MHIATHPGTGTETVKRIVESNGGTLHVVTHKEEAASVPLDGLLLLGGADISPFFYGEENTYTEYTDRNRDIIEWMLVRRAITANVPIMGICRGHQMLAVASGGSLYQDITAETGLVHSRGYTHKLSGVDKPLAGHLPTWTVNSLHHQAVKTLPYGFRATAHSKDGIIESIWRPGALGVQWHPELMITSDKRWIKLFHWFFDGLDA
jgi:gamma-glutamyl-gamma-aminobutyrate hydrolase PuuD